MSRHTFPLAVLLALLVPVLVLALAPGCQRPAVGPPVLAPGAVDSIVDASCGQCQFGLAGERCDLAVRIDGRTYFVDGTGIDDHGDAHASDGFCSAVRRARVRGDIRNGRFVARSFELVPDGGE